MTLLLAWVSWQSGNRVTHPHDKSGGMVHGDTTERREIGEAAVLRAQRGADAEHLGPQNVGDAQKRRSDWKENRKKNFTVTPGTGEAGEITPTTFIEHCPGREPASVCEEELEATLKDGIRSVAADLERDCRALGQNLLANGEEIPDWLLDDIHLALVGHGVLAE